MRTFSLFLLICLMIPFAYGQDKKWQKVLNLYQNHQYEQAITAAQKYLKRNTKNPGIYYVLGLSNFFLAQDPNTKDFTRIKRSIRYIHTAEQKDKDSAYYKIFEPDLKRFKDSLQHWAEQSFKNDQEKAKFFTQSIIYLYGDTIALFHQLYKKPEITPNKSQTLLPQDQALNQVDARGLRQGLWVKKYPNGKLKYMIYFKDGHPAGMFKRFYPDGSLWVEMHFDPQGHRASVTYYDRDGHKIATGYYYDQQRDSLWRFYWDDTLVIKEVMYKKGKKNGPERVYSIYYYPNLLRERYYKDGKLDSVAVDYYFDGTPKAIMFYKNGTLDGPYQVLEYNTGKPKIKGQYRNGLMDGLWVFHNPDGTVDSIEYKMGKPVNYDEAAVETKLMKAMEEAKSQYPEPEEMFRQQFGLDQW